MRRRRGTTAVEFALLAPVWVVLVFGFMEGATLWFHNHTVHGSAARAARIAAGATSREEATDLADAAAREWLGRFLVDPAVADVDVSFTMRSYGPVVRVDVSVPIHPMVGVFPPPGRLHATATAVHYGPAGGS